MDEIHDLFLTNFSRPIPFKQWRNEITSKKISAPLKNIIKLLDTKCSTVICENNYIDRDYLSEFQVYHSRAFSDFSRRCGRAHFFEKSIGHFSDLWDESISDSNYLGFCTLRPINFLNYNDAKIAELSRTVIKSPTHIEDREAYISCESTFDVNIIGKKFSVKGAPFIQQDALVGRCSQASVWMALRYLHKKLNIPQFTMDQITEMATRYETWGRVLPSAGLYFKQYINVFRLANMDPLCFGMDRFKPTAGLTLLDIMYTYMESGFPIVLALQNPSGRHAVCAVGHTFKTQKTITDKELHKIKSKYITPLTFIPSFIINDDASGPYTELTKKELIDCLKYIYIPLPQKVRLRGNDAEIKSYEFISENKVILDKYKKLISSFKNPLKEAANDYITALGENKIMLRTFLLPSNKFKEWLYCKSNSMSPIIKDIYRLIIFPRWIWVTEISSLKYYFQPDINNRRILGEIITDSTASQYESAHISIHLPGFMYFRRGPNYHNEEVYKEIEVFDDKPYRHYHKYD